MPTKAEIKAKYKMWHDDGTASFYEKKHNVGVTTKEQREFTAWHLQLRVDEEAEIKTASDYVEPIPPRDLETELDELKEEIKNLKTRVFEV